MAKIKDVKVDLYTEEVNEILKTPQSWLFRWGISTIFLGLVLLTVLSSFIAYPDVLTSKVIMTNLNPPSNLIARVNGKLSHLLIRNNEEIKAGQVLAVIENTANYEDLLKVSSMLSIMSERLMKEEAPNIPILEKRSQMGEITASYLQFLKANKEYGMFIGINSQLKEIALLEKELVNYRDLMSKFKSQAKLQNEVLSLTENDFRRYQDLRSEGMVSLKDFDEKKRELIRDQSVNEAQKIAITNTRISVGSIEKSKSLLRLQYAERLGHLQLNLEQAIDGLQSAIEKWKQDYLFIAPIDGRVSFFNFWAKNQNIKAGEEVFSILPTTDSSLIIKLLLPLQNSGKVKLGQKVNIKLDNYAHNENGMLKGIITNISLVPNNGYYAIDVELPDGMKTSYNKTLEYRSEMVGTGEIITEHFSLLERVFSRLRSVILR